MNPRQKALNEEFDTKNKRVTELLGKQNAGTITAEELKELPTLDAELDTLQSEIELHKAAANVQAKAAGRTEFTSVPAGSAAPQTVPFAGEASNAQGGHGLKKMVIPASVKRSRVTSFKARPGDEFTPMEKAYRFGQWFLASIVGNEKSRAFCKEHGLAIKVHTEGNNVSSGYLVPEEFENDLIDLREQFGVFRAWARNVTMRSDTRNNPRRKGGLTAYFVDEGVAAQESMKQWDRVGLTARKLMVLAKYSSELDEDAVIDIGNDLAEEVAYAFAIKEDQCGFIGDATSPYGGIIGVIPRLKAVDPVVTNIKGLVQASTDTWLNMVLDDFTNVKSRLPIYARRKGDVAWYTHHTFYHSVMEKLMVKAGGVSALEVAMGRDEPMFLGQPVRFVQVMDDTQTGAAGQVPVLYGALKLAADFGDRRSTTIAMSEHLNFAEDEIALRGTERFDINVHDVGDIVKPGPVVGLITP